MRRTATAAVLVLLAATLQLWVASPARALALPPSFQLVDYPTGRRRSTSWTSRGCRTAPCSPPARTARSRSSRPAVHPGSSGQVPSVRANGDHGMLGFALANDYATTGHVFLAYDKLTTGATTGFGMVEEWTALPGRGADHPHQVADPGRRQRHLAAARAAHPEPRHGHGAGGARRHAVRHHRRRHAATTATRRRSASQDTNQPYGKVLHLDPSGAGVASNPFYSAAQPSSWRSRVYAYGIRNPFRLMLDPRNGTPYVGDVGWNETEEINTLEPGFNGGWPCYEGTAKTTFSTQATCQTLYAAGSAQPPLWSYPHAGAGAAVVAGMVYTGTAYPGAYRNSHFFGDYTRTQMWTHGHRHRTTS